LKFGPISIKVRSRAERRDVAFIGQIGLWRTTAMTTLIDNSGSRVRKICERHGARPDALIEILREVQAAEGYVAASAQAIIADALNITRAEVRGVVSFYHDFRREPPARRIVKICRAEACQANGAMALIAEAEKSLGVRLGERHPDGAVELEAVYCLGNCALGPAAMLGEQLHGRVKPAELERLATTGSASVEFGEALRPSNEAITVYVPRDAAALSVGAELVAANVAKEAKARGADVNIIRNGSRGLFWLEPLVEVATDGGRIAYGPVAPADVASLFEAGFLNGAEHELCRGPTEKIPYLANQERLTFARCGIIDPLDLENYEAHGGLAGLRRALQLKPVEIVDIVKASGLRGRGGAGFPAGVKWETALNAAGEDKYICCNADEGDSGTFADRMLMEGDPFSLIEGMIIAGRATGAETGYIYLRSEYPHAISVMREAIGVWHEAGLLGDNIAGSGQRFQIHLRIGAGAYICGEESSMLESLEGKRGEVRAKPPIPAISGLFGKPTIVNNVLTLATAPIILARGANFYARFGAGRSRGTQPFQLAGDIARGGLVEKSFGVTLRELIEGFGGGALSGKPARAVQIGGPLGAYLSTDDFGLAMDYETLTEAGAMLGHGGVVVFNHEVDMARQARFAMEFCEIESCGKCTPCRLGAVRGKETLDKIIAGADIEKNLEILEDLCDLMTEASLCAMGGLTPMPVQSALEKFPEDFGAAGAKSS